jgi:hypothetical protein
MFNFMFLHSGISYLTWKMLVSEPYHFASLACLALPYFSTLSHKRRDFFWGGGIVEHEVCVFCLYLLAEIFLILGIIRRNVIMNVLRSSGMVPLSLVRFLINFEFLSSFFRKPIKYQIL